MGMGRECVQTSDCRPEGRHQRSAQPDDAAVTVDGRGQRGQGRGRVAAGVQSEHQVAGRLGAYWPSVMGTDYSAGIMGFGAHGREIALAKNIGSPSEGVDGCSFDEDQTLDYWRAGVVATFGFRLGRENRLNFQLHGEHIEADRFMDPVDGDGNKCKNYPFLGYLRPAGSTLMSFSAQFERDTRDDFFALPGDASAHRGRACQQGYPVFGL